MSASRCFDEMEYSDIHVLSMKGKSRVITVPEDLEKFWNQNVGILRNPVIQRFIVEILYLILDYPHKHYTFKYFKV